VRDSEALTGTFGTRLRLHRAARGITQEELADRSGLSVRAIADMERGRTARPYPSSVRRLADALVLSASERDDLVRAARPVSGSAAPLTPRPPAAAAPVPGPADELGLLTRVLLAIADGGGTVTVSAGQAGPGGAGTLALHWVLGSGAGLAAGPADEAGSAARA
jgi:transcriptional regulator with XRE-family HTH domain